MTALLPWVRFGCSVLGAGAVPYACRAAARRLHSTAEFVGFRRDLGRPFDPPRARIPLRVRPIAEPDLADLLRFDAAALSAEEKWDRVTRRRLLESGIGTCHVAVTGEDEPCFMLWLMDHRDNDRIQTFFRHAFPPLAPDEALLEGAFTPARFRGQGVMATATALVAERAAAFGARWAVCYVDRRNTASIKGCLRAGFAAETIRTERWRLFMRHDLFAPTADRG